MKKVLLSLCFASLLFTACEKDDPEIPHEQELITKLVLSLYSDDGVKYFIFEDPDGDGGAAPTITNDTLKTNTVYDGVISVYTIEDGEEEEITYEIIDGIEDHQFFYNKNMNNLLIEYADPDEILGLFTRMTTTESEAGKLTITLRHMPNKDAEGVAEGDITNAGGETDIEVTFDVVIE